MRFSYNMPARHKNVSHSFLPLLSSLLSTFKNKHKDKRHTTAHTLPLDNILLSTYLHIVTVSPVDFIPDYHAIPQLIESLVDIGQFHSDSAVLLFFLHPHQHLHCTI